MEDDNTVGEGNHEESNLKKLDVMKMLLKLPCC